MAECRVIVEFRDSPDARPTMHWEHTANTHEAQVFLLLGQAFDISRRESNADFHHALAAFLRGAMLQKEDLADLIPHLDDQGAIKPR